MQFDQTPARVPPSFDPPGALNFGSAWTRPLNFGSAWTRPLNFGQLPPIVPWDTAQLPPIPTWETNVTPADLIEPPIMNGPAAADPLRVFGLTNEERVVNVALILGALGTAWLLFAPR